MKCPEEKIYYGVICERFPEPSVYFETFESAIRWAKSEQPAYRPYYIVECVEHYEICGSVDDKKETKEMKDENKTYEQGLSDAWEAARKIITFTKDGGLSVEALEKIFGTQICEEIVRDFDVFEAIAKIKAYEEKQQKIEQEIKVGDEACRKDRKDCKFVVTAMTKDKLCFDCISKQGVFYQICDPNLIEKTGRYFPQVEELLKAMKEGQ